MSGLAKAFFYAGSRALLVSHWPVVSDAAVALTTRMLTLSRQGMTRAEAHRQAMMALINTEPARNAHPALWAPFVVVGGEVGGPEGRSKCLSIYPRGWLQDRVKAKLFGIKLVSRRLDPFLY